LGLARVELMSVIKSDGGGGGRGVAWSRPA
jgi:hypothetical protein